MLIQIRAPDERTGDLGEVADVRYRVTGNRLVVEDVGTGKQYSGTVGPGDDIKAAVRKLVRAKHGELGAFYNPIRYPRRGIV